MLMMGGVNRPWIEIPTFAGNNLNWRQLWEQFQATIHDKPHLEDVDKLTCLRDTNKVGPAMYLIQGLTQTTESFGEAIKCLKDCYDCPRVTHHEPVRSIFQATIMKANNGKGL